jgi:TPR repeat protein
MLTYLQRHVGNAYAQLALAQAYDLGHFDVPRDAERTFELYTLAARQRDAHAQCCVGICGPEAMGHACTVFFSVFFGK